MKTKNLVLGIGIIIVFMFLLHNGIRAFYDSPKYEDFCGKGPINIINYPDRISPTWGTNCTYSKQLREKEQTCYNNQGQPVYEYDENGCQISVIECNYCQKNYDTAVKNYTQTVFVIAILIGIITLLIGFAVLSIEPVGSSLMASGLGAIIYGTTINWENLQSIGRFVLLLIAFILLIWIAIRLNSESEKKDFWQKLGLKRK